MEEEDETGKKKPIPRILVTCTFLAAILHPGTAGLINKPRAANDFAGAVIDTKNGRGWSSPVGE